MHGLCMIRKAGGGGGKGFLTWISLCNQVPYRDDEGYFEEFGGSGGGGQPVYWAIHSSFLNYGTSKKI